jgi:predicted DNA-binding transcriptional regulator AlpA
VGKRTSITPDINGTELARQVGIGRSTLGRWVKPGKLPKPTKSISGMLMFGRGAGGHR